MPESKRKNWKTHDEQGRKYPLSFDEVWTVGQIILKQLRLGQVVLRYKPPEQAKKE